MGNDQKRPLLVQRPHTSKISSAFQNMLRSFGRVVYILRIGPLAARRVIRVLGELPTIADFGRS